MPVLTTYPKNYRFIPIQQLASLIANWGLLPIRFSYKNHRINQYDPLTYPTHLWMPKPIALAS